jgi:hypothetical protein
MPYESRRLACTSQVDVGFPGRVAGWLWQSAVMPRRLKTGHGSIARPSGQHVSASSWRTYEPEAQARVGVTLACASGSYARSVARR